MRINLIFLSLIIPLLEVSAASHAQTITLSKENISIEDVFKALKQQADYDFVYSKRQLEGTTNVSIAVKNATIKEVLDHCFENQPLSYVMEDRTIIIKRVNSKSTVNAPMGSGAIKLTGKVTDSLGKPLFGATVKILGETNETRTNEDGTFSITSELNSGTLIIAFIGYKTQQIKFDETSVGSFDVELSEIESVLKEFEIVSTGYQNIPKERATGSFTTVNEKMLNRNVGPNILDRLEGITSGLLLNRGLPNATGLVNSNISIRGRSTIFANAEPLIVLDGFPYEGTIDQINPADIENVNVLKDAAAASIWGTRASNGVIIITTKKGRNNQKLEVSMASTVSLMDKPNQYYKPQISSSDFIDLEQFLFSKGFYNGALNNPYSTISPAVSIFYNRERNLISSVDSAQNINQLKTYDVREDLNHYTTRAAVYQQHQLNLRGGGKSNSFYLSAGYDKNLENSVTNSYDRYTLNSRNTYTFLNQKLEVSGDVNFVSSTTRSQSNPFLPYTPYDRFSDQDGNSLAVVGSSTFRASYLDTAGAGKLLDWQYRPKDELGSNSNYNKNQYRLKAGINYKVFTSLNLNMTYQYLKEENENRIDNSIDSYYTRNLINRYSSIINNQLLRQLPLGGILNKSQVDLTSKITRLQLSYQTKIAMQHEINAIAGFESIDNRISNFGQTLYGFNPNTLTNSNNSINPTTRYPFYYEPQNSGQIFTGPDSRQFTNITQSFYANISYSYKGRYIASGSARNDRSNLFGVKANQKAVPLWSAGLSWLINGENFYKLEWLPVLKFRATYGYNGNIDKTVSGYLTVRNNGLPNEWNSNYSVITNPPNPLLKWEKVKTWNLGADYSFRNSRIAGSIDIYQKDALDLIGNNPIAAQSGVSQFRGNGASLRTKGIDAILNTRNTIGKFKWSSSILFNYNTDKVTKYDIRQTSNQNIITGNFNNPLVGYPYYAIFSLPSAGLDGTGSPQGYLNGLISKDYSRITSLLDPEQIRYHGSASPKYFGNVMNTLNYRQIELSLNIGYKFDYFFRRTGVFNGYASEFNGTIDYDKRWQKPGDELTTNIPVYNYPQNSSVGFFQNSEHLVESGDHIRIQDIRVSYNLTNHNFFRSLFSNATVYVYAKNMGIIWRKNSLGIDPDYGYNTPQPFSGSLGINLNLK